MTELAEPGETRVAVAGDWHGNRGWVQKLIPALHRAAPDVKTILHVGDYGYWPERTGNTFTDTVDYWCARTGIERVLVTPGNHEWWPSLDTLFAAQSGEAIQIGEAVWMLPRGFRFTLAGRQFLSFGGAASIDYADRRPGIDWWAEEMPTDEQVDAAIQGGPAEVMITHEMVDGGPAAVERIIRDNPLGWADEELAYTALSRERVTRLWDAVRPEVLAHGHMHAPDDIALPDGRRVYSLGCDGQPKNIGLLTLKDLGWLWPEGLLR